MRTEENNDFKFFTPSKICYEWGAAKRYLSYLKYCITNNVPTSFKASGKIVTMEAIQNRFNESNEGQILPQQKNKNGLAYDM